jgi:hypothetical protein
MWLTVLLFDPPRRAPHQLGSQKPEPKIGIPNQDDGRGLRPCSSKFELQWGGAAEAAACLGDFCTDVFGRYPSWDISQHGTQ